MNAEQFNSRYPVGTPVFAYPGFRREDDPKARRLVTRTRTTAQTSACGDPMVWVDGEGSYIVLTHVDPVPLAEWEKARAEETAEAVRELGALPMPVGKPASIQDPNDRRRRIYVDGKGNGWIDLSVDPTTGERDMVGITDAWKIATATEIRDDTGDLREIGRCW